MTKEDAILLGVGGAVLLYLLVRYGVNTAEKVGHAVNPVNPDNVFSGSVNAVGEALTGDPYWTLGGWIYDVTHPDQLDPTAPAGGDLYNPGSFEGLDGDDSDGWEFSIGHF